MKTKIIPENLDNFLYFCLERENVANLKEQGEPWPWTSDEIMQKFFLNNIFRERDKTTAIILDIMSDSTTYEEAIEVAVVCRHINLQDTISEVAIYFNDLEPQALYKGLKERKARGDSVVNPGAYKVHTPDGLWSIEGILKIAQRVQEQAEALADELTDCTLKRAVRILEDYCGNNFIAYQTALDLDTVFKFKEKEKWVYVGPGSLRGIMRLTGEYQKSTTTARSAARERDRLNKLYLRKYRDTVEKLIKETTKKLNEQWPDDKLSVHNTQTALCEYDKYMRYSGGESGATQRKYRAPVEEKKGFFDF